MAQLVGLAMVEHRPPLEDRRGAGQSNAASRHGRRARDARVVAAYRAPRWTRDVGQNSTSARSVPARPATEYRERVANRKREPVGTSGWVRDEVQRITGDDPPRVIELPREGLRLGYSPLGTSRLGAGPSLTIGVAPEHLAELKAVLEKGVSPRVGINYVSIAVFDSI